MPRPKKDKEPRQKQKQRQKQTVIVNVGTTRRRRQKQSQRSEPAPRAPSFMPIPFPVPALRGPDQLVPPPPTLAQLLQAFQEQRLRNAPAPAALAPPALAPPAAPTQAVMNPIQRDKQQPSLMDTFRQQNKAARPVVSNPVSPSWSSASLPSDQVAPIQELVLEQKFEAGPGRIVAPPNPMVEPSGPIVAAGPASTIEPSRRRIPRPVLKKEQMEQMEVFDPQAASSSSSVSSSDSQYVFTLDTLLSKQYVARERDEKGNKVSLERLLREQYGVIKLPSAIRDSKTKLADMIMSYQKKSK